MKKTKLLTSYIPHLRYPISRHARIVRPLRLHLSIMRFLLYGGKANLLGG